MRKPGIKKKAIFLFCYAIGTILLVVTLYAFIKDFLEARKIDVEIVQLQTEIYDLQESNLKIAEMIKYFDSESYAEYKARAELGLVKPGETSIIFPQKPPQTIIKNGAKLQTRDSNLKKWIQYFFVNSQPLAK